MKHFIFLLAILHAPTAAFVPSPTANPRCTVPRLATSPPLLRPGSAAAPRPSSTLSATSLADITERLLERTDSLLLDRALSVADHVPALTSLLYFGFVSMVSMMPAARPDPATLAAFLSRNVGPTTNSAFAAFFPTLITPPTPVFLVWPVIALVQLLTVTMSALRPGEPALSQRDLSALAVANVASSAWLLVSSRAMEGLLPLRSFLVLPLVPILSGYPLKMTSDESKINARSVMFGIYSSFTTIASFLALTVELQHGGRIPLLYGLQEVNALIFLALFVVNANRPKNSIVKKIVNAGAVSGILLKRIFSGGFLNLFFSASFLGTLVTTWISFKQLFGKLD
mmetsp:Transcript_38318/g.89116  ORF Transcript_38318/g.89116 Transcript_38318/m.89116 type:complete len:341 (-) Transcript_38318:284-1306(-)